MQWPPTTLLPASVALVRPRARFDPWTGWLVVVAVSCCVGGAPERAHAQADAAYDEATQRAVVEFNHGNWEEAQALFRRAHELDPNARTWRGLGICAFELRQYVQATGELEASLVDPRKPLTAEQRAQVKTLLAQAREFVSVYHLRVRPPDAEVFVDGRLTKLDGERLHLDPGPHSVVVRAPGYEERRAEFRAGAGVQDELSIELALHDPAALEHADESKRGQPTSPRAEPRNGHKPRVWTWTLAGAAVAAAGTAVGLRLAARNADSEYEACTAAQGNCGPVHEYGDRVLRASYATAAVSGALLLGATLSFWLEGNDHSDGQSAALMLGADGVQLRAAF